MKTILILLVIIIFNGYSCNDKFYDNKSNNKKDSIVAPFTGIDTITTNDWWNRKPNEIIDVNVKRKDVIAFGICTTYNNKLKLSAQLFPLYPEETREVRDTVL
ncbi:hypothetical protein [uncultured Aquimarina sp.]|uniref:hypothetical protein n=1 Tax=uncultured Aquimarina sp. TaxID=575652 RepID=UPI00261C7B71|nr:hypothetical protein [uncultured Aquimarina sp.]